MTVGDRIRKQRELLKISQTELAEKIKISKQTLYKYEKNIITNIPSNKIEELAKILHVSEAYLMGWEDNFATDILSDRLLTNYINKLRQLNKEHQQTIYDNIEYWYEKEKH